METPDIPVALEVWRKTGYVFRFDGDLIFVSRALITSSAKTRHEQMARAIISGAIQKCHERG